MTERPFAPRALGEIAVRCRDRPSMIAFYGDVLGLKRLEPGERGGHSDAVVFFRLGESHGGHVAVLALFDAAQGGAGAEAVNPHDVEAGDRSSLHHLALSLPWDEQDAAARWLRERGHGASVQHFDWTGWRGVFTRDPDGNTVELVAADPEWHLE